MIGLWTKGLIAHRLPRLVLAGLGVALATALVAAIGLFAASSARDATARATAGLAVDWQVAVQPGVDPGRVEAAVRDKGPAAVLARVGYAKVDAFGAVTGATTQTTGPGEVLGFPPSYGASFPGQMRLLAGRADGVLVFQQTASNLRIGLGDTFTVTRADGRAVTLPVDGIVELPNAVELLRPITGTAPAVPTAPTDNVALLPLDRWATLFSPVAGQDGVRYELHARLDRAGLPADPAEAAIAIGQRGRAAEAATAGAAIVGNTLAARLDAVRGDALYARVLFLFLGLPGAVLGVLMTGAMLASGAERRRREQALLRLRGASSAQVSRVLAMEAGCVALVGGLGGAVLGGGVATFLHASPFSAPSLWWLTLSAVGGVAVTVGVVLLPVLMQSEGASVADDRRDLASRRPPVWRRLPIDGLCLAASAAIFWKTANSGYQIVLAPEGVATSAVDYQAFLAPLLLWLGAGLLALRLGGMALDASPRWLPAMLRPLYGGLAEPASRAVTRSSRRVTAATVMMGLTLAFALAVSIFGATFQAQGLVDARLTNGADVTVTGTSMAPAGAALDAIRSTGGVAAAAPMQHRFAYVGNDLQDLYGIDPHALAHVTDLENAYFADRDARGTLARLIAAPDGILVSQETVNDFQLAIGDLVNLRLLNATDGRYHTVPFRLVGVVNEFPTAPKDSFLVANMAYVAAQTGSEAAEIVLVRTSGRPAPVADAIRSRLPPGTGLKVTDLSAVSKTIGSSLTAIDLAGLDAVNSAFALVLLAMSTGLVLVLTFSEHRRTAAVLWALGADARAAHGLVMTEGLLVLGGGLLIGICLGLGVAVMLVKLLTGVFDPPPDTLTVPWTYVAGVLATAIGSTAAALAWIASWRPRRDDLGSELSR